MHADLIRIKLKGILIYKTVASGWKLVIEKKFRGDIII